MHVSRPSYLFLYCVVLAVGCNTGTDDRAEDDRFTGKVFREHIRSTEPRTPEEEQAGFLLPEGFQIELFAAEPDIGKPINLAFDSRGRMWVTQSFEYPFAAEPGRGSDRITILEDTDGDGRADTFTHFNDTLNIPIGIMPVGDGAVAYSIPNVYWLGDSDADGRADNAEVLLGPFEHRDTHGMVNNFMRGYDGWIHACHGFTNESTVAGSDGDSITMISGNTFRFRLDGSRVEHMTHGRINPFGLAYDERGYLYSTDCHTSPLYQLIRGGDYYQWGKEEGMGFAPDMKPLEREATALAGIAYYADNLFPEEYRSNFYIGDVVTSRVYRNSSTFKGSTPVGKLEEDFVLSEDPWFRPVDVKLGPDGALYVADFYNSIIGHYEVPLNHPKRDKTRGRIWRITYKGKSHDNPGLATADASALIQNLNHDNMAVRFTAGNELTDRIGKESVPALQTIAKDKNAATRQRIHALWVLHRLAALSLQELREASADEATLVRLHAYRIMLERPLVDEDFAVVLRGLKDDDPHVRRAATELLVKFPQMRALEVALAERDGVPDFDSHQLYTTRLILRNLLRHAPLMHQAAARRWDPKHARYLVDVIVGVHLPDAAMFLAENIEHSDWEGERLVRQYEHLARYIPIEHLGDILVGARESNDPDEGYIRFKGIQQGLARRGADEPIALRQWGTVLAEALLEKYPADTEFDNAVADKQRFANALAAKYRIGAMEPRITAFFSPASQANADVKISALHALLTLDTRKYADLAAQLLADTVDIQFKNRVAQLLGDFPGPAVNRVLAEVNDAPPDLQRAVVMALASTKEGKDIIFEKVQKGELLPRTLIQPQVEERILRNINAAQLQEFKSITEKLPPVSEERQTLIDTRLIAFQTLTEPAPLDSGKMIFTQSCAPCHAIAGEGGSIGPQLDGVGKWGARALTEKILDPNRNVSEAFRTYTITLKDGKVLTGLFRREEGEVLVFADIAGREFSVPKNEIADRQASRYTLMPDNFGETLSPAEFNALLQYLLSLQS